MTKTQIAILWGLALVVIVAFVVAGRLISRPADQNVPFVSPPGKTYHLPQVAYSAKGVYERALQAAASWQGDAQLVSATAYWAFVRLDHFSQPVEWVFQFFSPSTQRIYVASVNDTSVTPIRSSLTPYPLAAVSIGQWQVDSHEALNTWLNQGGGRLLELHPAVDVSARLVAGTEGVAEWVVVGAIQDVPEVQMTRIDAATGTVLQ
ncbi:MAG: hypothetical protein JW934_24520 [Anaerolineae bacterium]|nr:hypothetical protein [Anaerolineae bacterium]